HPLGAPPRRAGAARSRCRGRGGRAGRIPAARGWRGRGGARGAAARAARARRGDDRVRPGPAWSLRRAAAGIALVAAGLAGAAGAGLAAGEPPGPGGPDDAAAALFASGLVVVRIGDVDRARLARWAAEIDLWSVLPRAGYALALVDR